MGKKGKKTTRHEIVLTQEEILAVRFMHCKISPHFSGCGRLVTQTLQDIRDGKVKVEGLPQIVVMVDDLKNGRSATSSGSGGGGTSGSGSSQSCGKKKSRKKKKKKKGRRGRDYDSEEEEWQEETDNGGAAAAQSAGGDGEQPRYYSLNNRRLYVFKELAKEGFFTKGLRVRARFLSQESAKQQRKYTAARCSLWATFDESLTRKQAEGTNSSSMVAAASIPLAEDEGRGDKREVEEEEEEEEEEGEEEV